jgi:hypothetical protein
VTGTYDLQGIKSTDYKSPATAPPGTYVKDSLNQVLALSPDSPGFDVGGVRTNMVNVSIDMTTDTADKLIPFNTVVGSNLTGATLEIGGGFFAGEDDFALTSTTLTLKMGPDSIFKTGFPGTYYMTLELDGEEYFVNLTLTAS